VQRSSFLSFYLTASRRGLVEEGMFRAYLQPASERRNPFSVQLPLRSAVCLFQVLQRSHWTASTEIWPDSVAMAWGRIMISTS